MVDRLSHPHVAQRAAPVVERDVYHPQGRLLDQPVGVLAAPPRRFAERHLDDGEPPRLELGRARERLGDDAHHQRVGRRGAAPVVGVAREQEVVVVLPGDEPPGAGSPPHRLVRSGRGNDARHGHRQEFGEDGERLRELERDRAVAQHGDAAHVARAASGVVLRAGDRVEGPGAAPPAPPAARGAGREHAQQARAHGVRRERRPVVELDASSQVKHVPHPPAVNRPAVGERGLQLSVGVEPGEPVVGQGHHLPRGHVGREGGVERARVVGLVVGEARAAGARASSIAGSGRDEGGEGQFGEGERAHGSRCRKG